MVCKILSFLSIVTEILYDIGLSSQIVGVIHGYNYPEVG